MNCCSMTYWVRLLKMQCVIEDGSLAIEEKLAMIDAINGYDGA